MESQSGRSTQEDFESCGIPCGRRSGGITQSQARKQGYAYPSDDRKL